MNRKYAQKPQVLQSKTDKGFPKIEHIIVYFDQKKFSEDDAVMFYQFYNGIGWHNKNGSRINWKTAANNWIWQLQQQQLGLQNAFGKKIKRLQQLSEIANRVGISYR